MLRCRFPSRFIVDVVSGSLDSSYDCGFTCAAVDVLGLVLERGHSDDTTNNNNDNNTSNNSDIHQCNNHTTDMNAIPIVLLNGGRPVVGACVPDT